MKKNASKLGIAVGQLIIGKVPGFELSEESGRALEQGTMGGVTLFAENARDQEQLLRLIASIKTRCQGTGVVAVDQEGGAVQRFDHILTPLPSAMALSATGNWQQVQELADISAKQLALCGVNCNLAPTLDICSNPLNPVIATRSFGSDPGRVKDYGIAVSVAFQKRNILAVGKHFPGHGATMEDSHTDFAVNLADSKTMWQRELVPFRSAPQLLPAILTAHIWMPSIDEQEIPASLSPRVTTGLLRQYLGFNGLIMTDDLLMKSVADRWGIGEAAVLAVLAGADQVLVCGTVKEIESAHQSLMQAVKDGRLTESRLNQSLERIKFAFGNLKAKNADSIESRLASLQQCVSLDKASSLNASICAISALRGNSPSAMQGEWVVVAPDHPRYKLNLASYLSDKIKEEQLPANIIEKRYPLDPTEQQCSSIADFCRSKNCIYLTFRTLLNRGQIQLGRALAETTRQRLAVATDLPYDLIGLPSWDNCLATFDPSDLAMEALSLVLTGHPATGTCPVSLQIEV